MATTFLAVVMGLAALFSTGLADAQQACGGVDCMPSSQHVMSTINRGDGVHRNDIDFGGLTTVAAEACKTYADAHTTSAVLYEMSNCKPVLPISGGSQWSSVAVNADYRSTDKANGTVISSGNSDFNLMTAECWDSVNMNNVVTGNNAQCFCKAPMSWDEGRQTCLAVQDTDMIAKSCNCTRTSTDSPIDPVSGALVQQEPLGMTIGQEGLFAIYDSEPKLPYVTPPSPVNGVVGSAAAPPSALPQPWNLTTHKALEIQRNGFGSVGIVVQAFRGNGQRITFTHPTSTTYTAVTPDVREQMVPVLDGSGNPTSQVRIIDTKGNVELYDMGNLNTGWTAPLQSISYADGGSVSYSYSTTATPSTLAPMAGLLLSITDAQGRAVKFRYDMVPGTFFARVKQIQGTDGRLTAFTYDSGNRLTQVTWPDSKIRKYLYERADLPWALTGITDENDSRMTTYSYDLQGRATAKEQAGGVNSYAVSYGTPPARSVTETIVGSLVKRDHRWVTPQNTTLTLPNGTARGMTMTDVGGKPFVTGQTQAAGSGTGASSAASTYDASGNLLSQDDFQGNRTCYAYDSSNRQTVRVEGLAMTVACSTVTPGGATMPAGARKIMTTWHPDWRKPVTVVQPLRKVSTVYHGQPDPFNGNATASCTTAPALPNAKPAPLVCKEVEQATLANGTIDSSVPARASSFTYDATGRILTSTDANNRTTAYTYYGDNTLADASAPTSDPYFDSVALLVNALGTDGSTAVLDQSGAARTLTVAGNAQISTAQSYLGSSSLKLDGNGDYVQAATGVSDFAMGTGDFTIEFFARKSANGINGWDNAFSTYSTSNASDGYYLELSSTRGFLFGGPSAVYLTYSTNPNDSAWHHWAVSRAGTGLKLFKDGVVVASATNSVSLSAANPRIGTNYFNEYFNGYLHMRVTKGVARYTANFTPPTIFPTTGAMGTNAIGHSVGDLQSVTNAAGHVTTFNVYDAAGRVRQMTDPKGIVTDITYTPRGWVSTVAVTAPGGSARTTNYSYDNAGQVTGIANPDGTTVSYGYDAAHRLTSATDARGNSVTYTLDNVGSRIAEEVKDPSGTLQRSIARSFDALNRLQQVTGAAR